MIRPVANPTRSYWLHSENAPKQPQLPTDLPANVDVLIIGCGLSGASTAYWLSKQEDQPKKTILVVDSRGVSEGATGRNGGHCWPSYKIPSKEELELYSEEELVKAQLFKFECVTEMIDFITKNNVDCELKLTGAYNIAKCPEDLEEFTQSADALKSNSTNCGNLTILQKEEARKILNSTRVEGALEYDARFVGQFWPAKFVHYLIQSAQNNGVLLRNGVHIKRVERLAIGGPFTAWTESGEKITAKIIVYATNGYTAGILPELKDFIFPVRGQVIATKPMSTTSLIFPKSITLNDGYEYLIQRRSDGRIIFGGFRWRSESPTKEVGVFDDSTVDPTVGSELREYLPWFFDGAFKSETIEVEYEWTGVMGYTADSRPLIGPLRPNEYILAGYNGNGMTRCFKAGKVIAEMISGALDPQNWIRPLLPSRIASLANVNMTQNDE